MTLLKKIDQAQTLWSVMLPHVPQPDAAWFGRWCDTSPRKVEHAIVRASKKFRADKLDGTLDGERVWRYVSAVIAAQTIQPCDVTPTKEKTMTEKTLTPEDATAPNLYRDLAEDHLRTGKVDDLTSIADAKEMLNEHFAVGQ